MRPFEYAKPQTEAEALAFLNDHGGHTAVLAGGTDLLNTLKADLLAPARVVDINGIESLKGIHPVGQAFQPAAVGVGQAFQPAVGQTSMSAAGLLIGALTTLEEILDSPFTAEHPAL
ncbi:MAG: FAD binding domain-containing protein, partial [Planctomycetaceae bacterium]